MRSIVIFSHLLAKALPRRETHNARLCGAPHTLWKVRRCVEIPMQKKEFRPLHPSISNRALEELRANPNYPLDCGEYTSLSKARERGDEERSGRDTF